MPGEAEHNNESAWTIEEGTIQLDEDLFVGDEEDFYFGSIFDLALRDDGQMYVLDGRELHIKVLSPEGELLETIGREGEGPGEFEQPSNIVLARGDSIFVRDRRRISVFSPDHTFSHSFTVQSEGSSPLALMVPEEEPVFVQRFAPPARGLIEDDAKEAVRLVDPSGEAGDTLFTTPAMELGHSQDGNVMTYFTLPFGRGPNFAYGPDLQIHYAWSGELTVTTYSLEGEQLETVEVPFEPVPIAPEELDEHRERQHWNALREIIADTKPALDHFLVDDVGRYWFKRATEDQEQSDWWIVDPESQHVAVVPLPSHVTFLTVRDGYAYGRAQGEYGEPALARYRVLESSSPRI